MSALHITSPAAGCCLEQNDLHLVTEIGKMDCSMVSWFAFETPIRPAK
jgi:hypothetical protein